MNVIITLPANLIAKIAAGIKTVEMRRKIFHHMNPYKDVIYIAQKGTDNVIGYITPGHIIKTDEQDAAWDSLEACLGITRDFYDAYWLDTNSMYFIGIESFKRFARPLNMQKVFRRRGNPQCFYYTEVNIRYASDVPTK